MSVSMVVQGPPPAGRRWNSAVATPEPASAESEETVTEAPPSTAASAGAVSDPVGFVLSTTTSWIAESSVLPARSVTRTRTRASPSAGCPVHVTL